MPRSIPRPGLLKLFVMRCFLFAFLLIFTSSFLKAQGLLDELEGMEEPQENLVPATFKGSRIINGHSVITRKRGAFEFLIAHRFGRLNSGAYELFGIDNANVRFGFEYGINDRLTLGFGRNSFEKTYDGFYKLALLRQQNGKKIMPISLTIFSSIAWKSLRDPETNKLPKFSRTLSYVHQVMVAQKVNKNFSWQLMPTIIHFNYVTAPQKNFIPALGFGGRYKVSDRISINGEYFLRYAEEEPDGNYNAIAIGVDIETGGHVFQLQFTNARAMIEKGFIRETTGNFFNGDIHFGFNLTRVF